MGDE
jgi:hypothetical protein